MNKRINKKKLNQICDGYTNKTQRDKNKTLCKRYPFLIPRDCEDKPDWNRKAYDWTLMEFFPEGWWKAFGLQLCEDLREELIRCNYLHEFRLMQIKEKYGRLRVYYGPIPKECNVEDIIEDYSVLSENICMHCSRPDTSMIDWGGWLTAICEDCYNKIERKNNREFGYKITPYSHWKSSKPKMADERKFTRWYRKILALDIGNWNEYLQIYEEFSRLDRRRVSSEGNLTEYVDEKHTRDLRDKAEKIRIRWRAS